LSGTPPPLHRPNPDHGALPGIGKRLSSASRRQRSKRRDGRAQSSRRRAPGRRCRAATRSPGAAPRTAPCGGADRFGLDSAVLVDMGPVHGESLVGPVVPVLGAGDVLEQRRGGVPRRWPSILGLARSLNPIPRVDLHNAAAVANDGRLGHVQKPNRRPGALPRSPPT
jgi:hypothetical protein